MRQVRESHYYGTRGDGWDVWRAVLRELPVDIIVDRWLKSPEDVEQWSELSADAKAQLRERRMFFVVPRGAELQQQDFRRAERGEMAGHFHVQPASLYAPLLCTLPLCHKVNGIIELSSGNVTLQPEYEDAATHLWHPIPEAFKELHKQVVKCVRKHCVHRQLITTKGWVGIEADQLLSQGKAVITDIGV